MKNTKVTEFTDKELFEKFDQDNNTGFATGDLVKIYHAHQANEWEAVSFDELMAEIDQIQQLDNQS
jgi:hypothetical protein